MNAIQFIVALAIVLTAAFFTARGFSNSMSTPSSHSSSNNDSHFSEYVVGILCLPFFSLFGQLLYQAPTVAATSELGAGLAAIVGSLVCGLMITLEFVLICSLVSGFTAKGIAICASIVAALLAAFRPDLRGFASAVYHLITIPQDWSAIQRVWYIQESVLMLGFAASAVGIVILFQSGILPFRRRSNVSIMFVAH